MKSINAKTRWLTASALAVALAVPTSAIATDYQGPLHLYAIQGTGPDDVLDSYIETFEAENPGVEIQKTGYPSDKFVALLTAAEASGQPIDALLLNGQDLRRYALNESLLPLDDIDGNLDRFRPSALGTAQIDGVTYGLPYSNASGFPIFVNKAILDEHGLDLPETYEDFLAIHEVLEPTGISTFTHSGKTIYLWPVWFFTTYAQTAGNQSNERSIEILSGNGKFTDSDVVEALDLVFQFGRDGLLPSSIMSLDTPQAQAEFLSGKAAFWLHHASLLSELPEDFNVDVMLMPKLVAGDFVSQHPGGPRSILAVRSDADEARKAVALDFIQSLTTDEANQDAVIAHQGLIPVNAAVDSSDSGPVRKMADFSLITYLDWHWPPEITRAFQETIQGGVAGQITAEEAAAEIQGVLDRLIADGYTFAN